MATVNAIVAVVGFMVALATWWAAVRWMRIAEKGVQECQRLQELVDFWKAEATREAKP